MLRWLREAPLLRLEPAASPAPAGVPAWHGAVDALAPALEALAPRAARVRFAVSDHFVRYLTLPWALELRGEDERAAYLKHHFETVYGPRASDWRMVLERDGAGATRIAAAMDAALTDALREAAIRAGLQLASIEPLAVAAFNRLRRDLPRPGCFFVFAEPGRLTALLAAGGAPLRAASVRCVGAPAESELPGLLAAEAVDAGIGRDAAIAVVRASWGRGDAAPAVRRTGTLAELLDAPAPAEANA